MYIIAEKGRFRVTTDAAIYNFILSHKEEHHTHYSWGLRYSGMWNRVTDAGRFEATW
jgi:hypothetical protein